VSTPIECVCCHGDGTGTDLNHRVDASPFYRGDRLIERFYRRSEPENLRIEAPTASGDALRIRWPYWES
jgi:hypothetical protein